MTLAFWLISYDAQIFLPLPLLRAHRPLGRCFRLSGLCVVYLSVGPVLLHVAYHRGLQSICDDDNDDDDLFPAVAWGRNRAAPPYFTGVYMRVLLTRSYIFGQGGEVKGSSPLGCVFWVVCWGCMIKFSSVVNSSSLSLSIISAHRSSSFPLSHHGCVFCIAALLLHDLRSSNEYC